LVKLLQKLLLLHFDFRDGRVFLFLDLRTTLGDSEAIELSTTISAHFFELTLVLSLLFFDLHRFEDLGVLRDNAFKDDLGAFERDHLHAAGSTHEGQGFVHWDLLEDVVCADLQREEARAVELGQIWHSGQGEYLLMHCVSRLDFDFENDAKNNAHHGVQQEVVKFEIGASFHYLALFSVTHRLGQVDRAFLTQVNPRVVD